MSWRLSLKLLAVSLVIFSVTGCSTSLYKKRGLLFRGDWAFEINRTPWVGCPGDIDAEGCEKGENGEKGKKGLLNGCSLTNKAKCIHGIPQRNCAQCCTNTQGMGVNGVNGVNNGANGTGMGGNPMANLPPGSLIVPNGVVLPNGTFMPNAALMQPQTNQQFTGNHETGGNLQNGTPPQPGTVNGTVPITINGTVTSMSPMENGMMNVTMADGTTSQVPMIASGMLINPINNQVVPGLTMSGYASPGYPPIGYSPTGYSPGQAQPYELPPLIGHTGTSSASLAGTASLSGTEKTRSQEQEKGIPQEAQASMPYPRFAPVPTHPVYQRAMGMAPNYQAMQAPMMWPPGMSGSPGYPPALNPFMNPYGMNPVLQQQMMQQARLKEQARLKAQANKVSKTTPESHIILAGQQQAVASTSTIRK